MESSFNVRWMRRTLVCDNALAPSVWPYGLEVCYLHPHSIVNSLYISCHAFAIIYFVLFVTTIIAHPSQLCVQQHVSQHKILC
jgi:hypothetical protein